MLHEKQPYHRFCRYDIIKIKIHFLLVVKRSDGMRDEIIGSGVGKRQSSSTVKTRQVVDC